MYSFVYLKQSGSIFFLHSLFRSNNLAPHKRLLVSRKVNVNIFHHYAQLECTRGKLQNEFLHAILHLSIYSQSIYYSTITYEVNLLVTDYWASYKLQRELNA